MPELLIVADDLSGAADAAAAAGGGALVMLDGRRSEGSSIVAIDLDSRRLTPDAARLRARNAVGGAFSDKTLVYQKMDSLLRGNWTAELLGIREALGAQPPAMAIIAPAWPERGRTTIDGRLHVDARPVDGLGLRDDYGRELQGDIGVHLATAGVSTTIVRAGSLDGVAAQLRAASAAGIDAVICDAENRADLDRVAVASLSLAARPFWVGSGGLVSSLVRATGRPRPTAQTAVAISGSCLAVVGSASPISRLQLSALEARGVVMVCVDPVGIDKAALLRDIERAVASGRDVAISIADTAAGGLQSSLVVAVADAIAPALPRIGSLILTGGETARAVLERAGVHAIRIIGEIEPGVPLGMTIGDVAMPVVTKAGAFGNENTLSNALSALKNHRPGVHPSSPISSVQP